MSRLRLTRQKGNYRPVCKQKCWNAVQHQLGEYLEKLDLLFENQSGFCDGYSTDCLHKRSKYKLKSHGKLAPPTPTAQTHGPNWLIYGQEGTRVITEELTEDIFEFPTWDRNMGKFLVPRGLSGGWGEGVPYLRSETQKSLWCVRRK